MNPSAWAAEWVEYAEHDFGTAKLLEREDPSLLEIIAFHCQQAAEKYLKAVIAQSGEEIPRIHDLASLSRIVRRDIPRIEQFEEICERLTPYGTISRYPQDVFEIDPKSLPQIIQWTATIRSAIRAYFELTDD